MLPVADDIELLRSLERAGYTVEHQPALQQAATSSRPGRLTMCLRTQAGTQVIAKFYCDGHGVAVFDTMQRLWQSPFGHERKPPGLARPLGYIAEADAVIIEWVEGRPLIELGAVTAAHVSESMRLLADLHTCGVVPERRRSWRGILRSLDRKLAKVVELAPQYVAHIQEVLNTLRAAKVKDTELVCAHGDFSARNVLVCDRRYLLVDWDRLQQADPARDVAYFGIWSWREAIRRGRLPDRGSLRAAAEAYEAHRPGCKLHKQLPFHVAAGLVRMCCSLITLWPQQSYLVPGLAKAALCELERTR